MPMIRILKIALAIMLLICLFNMPPEYYTVVRVVSMFGFGLLVWIYYDAGNKLNCIIFALLLVLFQPFVLITLDKGLWSAIDVIVAIFLLILSFTDGSKGKKKNKTNLS